MNTKSDAKPINLIIVEEDARVVPPSEQARRVSLTDPFANILKNSTNLFNQQIFTDDRFKLPQFSPQSRRIVRKRLLQIYKPNSPLCLSNPERFPPGEPLSNPSYFTELRLLPIWHYLSLIEPQTINSKGFYNVVVYNDGNIVKEIIDDYVYYDEGLKRVHCHPGLLNEPWVHIIIKIWIKLKGYEAMESCEPFEFVKTFSYPDWLVINPIAEPLETLISKFHKLKDDSFYYIARTKPEPQVGLFGFTPRSVGYVITGYYQEYGSIFIKIRSLLSDKWNNNRSYLDSESPSEFPHLDPDQSLLPLKEFMNIFHLIYCTNKKYAAAKEKQIYFSKLVLNSDARESKAKVLIFSVTGSPNLTQQVSFCFHFPSVKPFDLVSERTVRGESTTNVIPLCKLMIGLQIQSGNQQDSYISSVKQKLLKNEDGHFLPIKSNMLYEHIFSDYFKGYAKDLCFHLKLKPGKYFLRCKIEKLRVEYRSMINIVSSCPVKLIDAKMDATDHKHFLNETVSSKARAQQRNITEINQSKKGSWIICNNDFQSIGYGYLVFQVGINANFTMKIQINRKKLKESGYRIKYWEKQTQIMYCISVGDSEQVVLLLKLDEQFKGQRVWPPEGIEVTRILNEVPSK